MNETRRKKPSLEVQPTGVKLGLLYALAPISWGVGELLWRRTGADAAMMWMSVAAGIVFGCVTLAYSQGHAAGRAAGMGASRDAPSA